MAILYFIFDYRWMGVNILYVIFDDRWMGVNILYVIFDECVDILYFILMIDGWVCVDILQ